MRFVVAFEATPPIMDDAIPSKGANSRGKNPPVCKILRFFAIDVFSRAKSYNLLLCRRKLFNWRVDRGTFLFNMFLAISQQQSIAPRWQVLKNFLRAEAGLRLMALRALRCAFSSLDIFRMTYAYEMQRYLFGLVNNLLLALKYICPDPVVLARFGSQVKQQIAVRCWSGIFECLNKKLVVFWIQLPTQNRNLTRVSWWFE